MATPVTHDLGAFAAGEIPPPLILTFKDYEGNLIDLTDFTVVAVNIEAVPAVEGIGTGTVTRLDQSQESTKGKLRYKWSSTDMAIPSEYTLQAWVYNGLDQRYASDLFTYTVYDGPGEAPGV